MSDVPRETPPVPASARGVFGSRTDVAEEFVRLLATDGVVRGLIGPREAPRLWDRHLLNCAVVTDLLAADADVCDIGSGAGLPGVVLAIRRPDLQVTLVEPLLRRTTFLQEAVAHLGLERVEVVRGRAETLHGQRHFDVVTSRAVAPLPRLLDWSMPLVRRGGEVLAMKGTSASQEVADAAADLRRWGVDGAEVVQVGGEVIDPPTTVIRIGSGRSSPLGWPKAHGGGDRRPPAARRPKGQGGRQ